ncbi:MAG: VOC family protein [Acidimicrobiia bacterium]|nr:VOC family protein [Acidimicrobiia bacterium]
MRSIYVVLRFDHVIMTVSDLDAASKRLFDEYGLGSVAGGRHPGHGTANRLVPLGRDYLEFVAVVDPSEAAGSAFGRWVGARALMGSLAGLCLRTTDIISIGRRLDLAPVPMSRMRPDGIELSWHLLGLDVAIEEGLPFFVEWDVLPQDHPGRAFASHRVEPRGISWVEVGGDAGRLGNWLGNHDLDVRSTDGPPGVLRFGLDTDAGQLVI